MSLSMPSDTPRAVIFMADNGQDPSECALAWKGLKDAGFRIDVATEHGAVPTADTRLVAKSLFKAVLGPKEAWTKVYKDFEASYEFTHPLSWSALDFSTDSYDALILPGGHDKPIKQYLESETLHTHLSTFWPRTQRSAAVKPGVVGAICHGVLVLAFAKLLHDVESTTLPQFMEGSAQGVASLWGLGHYYRTYPGKWTHEDVVGAMEKPEQYKRGPTSMSSSFVHVDPTYRYVSGRWPGDTEEFAQKIAEEVIKCRAVSS